MAYSVSFDIAAVSNGASNNASPVSVTPGSTVSYAITSWNAAINDNVAAAGRHLLQRFSGGTGTAQTPEKSTSRSPAASETGAVNYTVDPTLSGNPLVIMTSRNVATAARMHWRRWVPPNPRYLPTVEPGGNGIIWTMNTGNNTVPVDGGIFFQESDTPNPYRPIRGRRGREAGSFHVTDHVVGFPALATTAFIPMAVPPSLNLVQGADWMTVTPDAQVFLNLLTAAGGGGGTNWLQECDETITLTDVLLKQPSKNLTETLVFSDALMKQVARALTETLAISDTVSKTPGKSLTETLTISDALTKRPGKTLSETVALSDTLAKMPAKTLTETLAFTDTLAKVIYRALTETIVLDDTGSLFNKIKVMVLTEVLSMTDSVSKIPSRLLQESFTLDDGGFYKMPGKALAESLTLSDAGSLFSRIKALVLSETLTVTDSLAKLLGKSLTEQISLTDSLSKYVARNLSETMTLTDVLIAKIVGAVVKRVMHHIRRGIG